MFVITRNKYHTNFCTNSLLKFTPILNRELIHDFLKALKTIAVKRQDYETGAMLRDFERNDFTREELLIFLRQEYAKGLSGATGL